MSGVIDVQNAALLALTRLATPPKVRQALAEADEDPVAALNAATEAPKLDDPSPEAMIEQAKADLLGWAEAGITVVTVRDEGYPASLLGVFDRPQILWIRGELKPQDARSIAIVGTRGASSEGKRRAARLAWLLVQQDYTIVSGLAKGIDSAAHQSAFDAGGRTVAVIGTGVNRAFPRENAPLQHRIGTECAVVSQFEPDMTGRRWTFPQRNATMSGISRATIVVEASETSGARIQTRQALQHGRPVVLLRSLVEGHAWASKLVGRPGVRVLAEEDLDDVLGYIDADAGAQLSLI